MNNKQAFTLVELVIVIVVSAILSSIAISKIHINSLKYAAYSVLNDIRYAKSLSLTSDVYLKTSSLLFIDSDYYKSYWQFRIHCIANEKSGKTYKCKSKDKDYGYTIFSDFSGTHTGNPDLKEVAKDYINNSKYLGARFSGISALDSDYTDRTNLTQEFGIKYINLFYVDKFSPKSVSTIMFDEFGEMNAVTYNAKRNYSFKVADKFVVGLSLKDDKFDKDNSICILFDGKYSIGDIPKNDSNGQLLWTNKGKNVYCHEILK